MPLNYSKWDQLEVSEFYVYYLINAECLDSTIQLSDDSDIEGHPNVDKKSLIRFILLPPWRIM